MVLEENMVVAERFELVRMIGRGGMGAVWEARDLRLSTPCAVKFIDLEGDTVKVAEAHSRFQREAQAAAQLRSPHVVQMFDHGTWEGHPYIAMELLDGEDLAKRIEREEPGRLAAPFVVGVVSQLCRGLSRAHAAGIIHRDLKPDNVFLVNDDDRQIVKILDFGVAKSLHTTIEGSKTKSGTLLGTPYYMSPEQAQGVAAIDARSDLWAVAVIVFYCMTGRLPFDSDALGDLFVKIIVQPIPLPSSIEPSLPASFDAWWQRATERDPDKRFQTAKELAEALATALLGPDAVVPGSSPDLALSTVMPAVSVRAPLPTAGTFPGLVSSAGLKRGAPKTLFVAVAALFVIGGIVAGALAMRRRSPPTPAPVVAAEPPPAASSVAPPVRAAESSQPVAAPEKPVASVAPAVSVAPAHKPAAGKAAAPKPVVSAAPPPSGPAKEKPINLGF